MLVMSLKQRKRNFNQGWIHLQLRPVLISNVVLLPCRSQKFDSTTAVARRLKPSPATAVYYAAEARWNYLLFLGLKTLKKIERQSYAYVANESTPLRKTLNHNIHKYTFLLTYIHYTDKLHETSVLSHFFTAV